MSTLNRTVDFPCIKHFLVWKQVHIDIADTGTCTRMDYFVGKRGLFCVNMICDVLRRNKEHKV